MTARSHRQERSAGLVTLEDVATRAGVSRATASRVINGEARVAAATRRAVEQAVDALGYVPHRAARSLAAHRTDTIALVMCEPSGRVFADPFFGQVVRGVAGALSRSPYQLVLMTVQDDDEHARVERHLVRGNADGVLLVAARRDDPLPASLAGAGLPCVVAGRAAAGAGAGHVDADNAGGARRAVDHLVARGCATVGTVAGPEAMAAGADRLAGWRSGLAAAGRSVAPSLVAPADFTRDGGERATAALLGRHPDLDGLFVASDLMALGALDALRLAGRRVPDDVAVVGFDDSDLARSADPPLTTVRQPIEELGRRLVETLRARLDGTAADGTSPAAVVLHTDLVVRASA